MSHPKLGKAAMASAHLFLALAGTVLAAPAHAGSLQVDPIKVEISADRKIASVRVKNEDGAPVMIRAYALAWDQSGGEDKYQETSALILSPPVFTIPAGASQLVRVGLRNPAAGNRAYRLMVEEVPQANRGGGVQVALRLNLPLYAGLASGSLADLSWRAYQQDDKSWAIEATNKGKGYVRVEPQEVAARTGVRQSEIPSFAVVLPGASRRWTIGARPDIADRARFDSVSRGGTPDGQTAASLQRR